MCQDGLRERYDLVHSRHMLQHLYTLDVLSFLAQLQLSGSSYLLTTSFHAVAVNADLIPPQLANVRFRYRSVYTYAFTVRIGFQSGLRTIRLGL